MTIKWYAMNNVNAIKAEILYIIDILVAFSPIYSKLKSKKRRGNEENSSFRLGKQGVKKQKRERVDF